MKTTLLFLFFLLAAPVAFADNLLVTQSGDECGTGQITTACGVPGDTWTYSFITESNPTPIESVPGFNFEASISDFEYYINGVLQTLSTIPTVVEWFNASDGGGFEISGLPSNLIVTTGRELYSNGEDSPDITPGDYTFVDEVIPGIASAAWFPLTITPVPEPSPYGFTLMIGIGLLVLIRKRMAPSSR